MGFGPRPSYTLGGGAACCDLGRCIDCSGPVGAPAPAAASAFLDALPDSVLAHHLLPALSAADKQALRRARGAAGGWLGAKGRVSTTAAAGARALRAAAPGTTPPLSRAARGRSSRSTRHPVKPAARPEIAPAARRATHPHTRAVLNAAVSRVRLAAGDLLPAGGAAAAPALGARFPALRAVEAFDCADAPVTDGALVAFLRTAGPGVRGRDGAGAAARAWRGAAGPPARRSGYRCRRRPDRPRLASRLAPPRSPGADAARPRPAPRPAAAQLLAQVSEVDVKRCHYVGRGLLDFLRASCPRLTRLSASRRARCRPRCRARGWRGGALAASRRGFAGRRLSAWAAPRQRSSRSFQQDSSL
jgi:hypothetical protein